MSSRSWRTWGARSSLRTSVEITAAAFAALLLVGSGPGIAEPPKSAEVAPVLAPSGQPYSELREACVERDPLRKAYWGELHVHSKLSMDARMWGVRGTPDDVYLFAKGEEVGLPPYNAEGKPERTAQLERPLDFASLTDHASYQGEVALCTVPSSPLFEAKGCKIYRGEMKPDDPVLRGFAARMSAIASSLDPKNEIPSRNTALCGDDGQTCKASMASVWRQQQAAADRHYDRSAACAFTTFNGYEYTATPGLSKVHHNVIFRNDKVPAAPVAWVDHPDVYDFWGLLKGQCLEAGEGCDVLTLPHNSNLSNGRMFVVAGKDLPLEEQRERARLRAELEPLVEISQIKGDSECRDGMYGVVAAPDEFCAYEEWRPKNTPDCKEGTGTGALGGRGCVSRLDYVRHVLVEGLREKQRIGVNPYPMGIIAATDGHNANPGDVEEYSYPGWRGVEDATAEERLSGRSGLVASLFNFISSPGGVAGVWAEENSRDSLFDAMKRREVFGTSGPRMTARFFGGWGYSKEICADKSLLEKAYAGGVPMGGVLPPASNPEKSPIFVVTAQRDPGIPEHPGGLLQRAQVIKGWVDDKGTLHEKVYDVAGGANGASVELNTCTPRGSGSDTLCGVWEDPDFDASRDAVYYVRVLENPSCRWSQRQCNSLPEASRPKTCQHMAVSGAIQERLWTSPIWYEK